MRVVAKIGSSSLTDEQQDALRAFSELDTTDPRARLFS